VSPQYLRQLRLVAALIVVFVCALVTTAQSPAPQQPTQKAKASSVARSSANESAEGEKRFQTNCGRCHVPPESLSPREVKAVVRQMRVRANLTAEDERLILKYLAP
jgi:cytochrome c5